MAMIKSISYDQREILRNILQLYVPRGHFDLDPTYGKGNFYTNDITVVHKMDLMPQDVEIEQADCRKLPFVGGSLDSIVFDPPFVVRQHETSGVIASRFSFMTSVSALWQFYDQSLQEFWRILKPSGILVFKCQDMVSGGKQYMNHVVVANQATALGFYSLDLFILIAKSRLISPNTWKQQHARKFHSYFWVFQKILPRLLNGRKVDSESTSLGSRPGGGTTFRGSVE